MLRKINLLLAIIATLIISNTVFAQQSESTTESEDDSANSALLLPITIARERFFYAPGPVNGMGGGTNWAAPWIGESFLRDF